MNKVSLFWSLVKQEYSKVNIGDQFKVNEGNLQVLTYSNNLLPLSLNTVD